jgi:hypothetical protein
MYTLQEVVVQHIISTSTIIQQVGAPPFMSIRSFFKKV